MTYRDLKPNFPRERLDLFKTQFNGRIVRGVVLPMPQEWAQVDPHASRSELAVNNAQIVDDILCLSIFCKP